MKYASKAQSYQLKYTNKKGVTIIEIIIASMIAAMVLASLASIDYAVRMMYKNRGSKGMLSVEVTSILQHISRNIQLARGDGASIAAGNWGIEINPADTLSILQDKNSTPSNYGDDVWVYYGLNNNSIEFCNGQGSCVSSIATLGSGRIKSFTVDFAANSAQAALDNQVHITIGACVDPATCGAAEFTTETTISAASTGGPSI